MKLTEAQFAGSERLQKDARALEEFHIELGLGNTSS
jgi:hypothetical protein